MVGQQVNSQEIQQCREQVYLADPSLDDGLLVPEPGNAHQQGDLAAWDASSRFPTFPPW
jgi:hypothetical protein